MACCWMERKCKDSYLIWEWKCNLRFYFTLSSVQFQSCVKVPICRQDQYILAMTGKSLQTAGHIDRLSLQSWFKNKYKWFTKINNVALWFAQWSSVNKWKWKNKLVNMCLWEITKWPIFINIFKKFYNHCLSPKLEHF